MTALDDLHARLADLRAQRDRLADTRDQIGSGDSALSRHALATSGLDRQIDAWKRADAAVHACEAKIRKVERAIADAIQAGRPAYTRDDLAGATVVGDGVVGAAEVVRVNATTVTVLGYGTTRRIPLHKITWAWGPDGGIEPTGEVS